MSLQSVVGVRLQVHALFSISSMCLIAANQIYKSHVNIIGLQERNVFTTDLVTALRSIVPACHSCQKWPTSTSVVLNSDDAGYTVTLKPWLETQSPLLTLLVPVPQSVGRVLIPRWRTIIILSKICGDSLPEVPWFHHEGVFSEPVILLRGSRGDRSWAHRLMYQWTSLPLKSLV